MTGGIAAFIAAVGGTSLVCYWLTTRAENRGARRRNTFGDSSDSGGGSFTGGHGGDGWNIFSWFSSDHSSSSGSDNASSDSSGAAGDWSGSDSGGGGSDAGGGGDGGDGGGGGGG